MNHWREAIVWCVVAICSTITIIVLVVCLTDASKANCERRATMLETIASETDGNVIITNGNASP